jgi:hypothetical protein
VNPISRERLRLQQLHRWTVDPSLPAKSKGPILFKSAGWLLILAGTFAALHWRASPFIVVALSAFGGILGGVGFYSEESRKRWPLIARYLDVDRIQRRLADLPPEASR